MVTNGRSVVDALLEDLSVKVAARLLSDYARSCRRCEDALIVSNWEGQNPRLYRASGFLMMAEDI
jgi:hypothetical protein